MFHKCLGVSQFNSQSVTMSPIELAWGQLKIIGKILSRGSVLYCNGSIVDRSEFFSSPAGKI